MISSIRCCFGAPTRCGPKTVLKCMSVFNFELFSVISEAIIVAVLDLPWCGEICCSLGKSDHEQSGKKHHNIDEC
jgi:hypothetical protein